MRFSFLLMGIAVFFAVKANAIAINCQQHHCLAVVDAGSTGSRVHIYSYDWDKTNTPININEIWFKKINPGLAMLELNEQNINAYLTKLFSDAPESNLAVYFYATGGMRLLSKTTQQQFYRTIEKWFANHSEWALQKAKTLTGIEEGLFDWLAVNYQNGSLTSSNTQNVFGVMDMGGASVQIAFPVYENGKLNDQDLQKVDIYGQHFTLFVHSFLGLGQTEVTHQLLDQSTCFPEAYELPNAQLATGNAYACKANAASLINSVHKVNNLVQPSLVAATTDKWYVIGGLADLAKTKPFEFSTSFTAQNLLEQSDTQVCHQHWTTLTMQYPKNEYLFGYCLFSSYYYALLVEGYGISPQHAVNFSVKNTSWTIGVVLSQKQA